MRFTFVEIKTLWEGHKIWKNLSPVLTKQLFLLSNVEASGRFFQIFVAISEKLDFIDKFDGSHFISNVGKIRIDF